MRTFGASRSGGKRLIITSGDISDVDGFLALSEYAKTGSDVLFVMNFPACIGISPNEKASQIEDERNKLGLGYRYSSEKVFEVASSTPKYEKFMKKYSSIQDCNKRMKTAMTDMAHFIVNNVWKESSAPRDKEQLGKLVFYIGGINAVNPFSDTAVKNELVVFSDSALEDCPSLDTTEVKCVDQNGSKYNLNLECYDQIYVDFNGSMAFFSEESELYIQMTQQSIIKKICAAFIMGGISAEETPKTMPSIAGRLNRFSCATMNQLYHPENTARFFQFLSSNNIPAFVVTNNVVPDLTKLTSGKTSDAVNAYLKAQHLDHEFLSGLAHAYYENPHGPPPCKPFDHFVAVALARYIEGERFRSAPRKWLFYCCRYGVAIVSEQSTWKDALRVLKSHLDMVPTEGDEPFVAAKKASLVREFAVLDELREATPEAPAARGTEVAVCEMGSGAPAAEGTEADPDQQAAEGTIGRLEVHQLCFALQSETLKLSIIS